MSLFPNPTQSSHLLQFNAGKCIREGNLLKPDLRKGIIYLDRVDSDDQMMHFYWKPRRSNQAEDDLIIFPEEAEFVRVNECTTGRVYVLKFKQSNEKRFFWMQDKSDAQDEQRVARLNQLINDPSASTLASSGSRDHMNTEEERISQNQIMQFLQTVGGAGGSVVIPSDLNELPGFNVLVPTSESRGYNDIQPLLDSILDVLSHTDIDPSTPVPSVNTRSLEAILADEAISSALFPSVNRRLEISQLQQDPSYKEALARIDAAVRSGQLATILSNNGIASEVEDLESFLELIASIAQRRRGNDEAMDED